MIGSGYIPSFDFRLFEFPQFSPLQAQEYGAETIFSAGDPPWFVDASLRALAGITPFFQEGASVTRERAQRARDAAERVYREAEQVLRDVGGSSDCKEGRNIFGGCGPIIGSGPNRPGDASVGDDPTKSGQKVGGAIEKAQEFFKALPAGSGVFLIAVIAVIFLLLFARR